MSQLRNGQGGYSVAAFWGTLGGIAGAFPGLYFAIDYVYRLTLDPKFGAMGFLFLGLFGGLWVGEVFGCWLGLRLERYPKAFLTATCLVFLIPLVLLLGGLAWTYLLDQPLPALPMQVCFIFFFLVTLIGSPLLARYLSNLF